MLLGKILFLGTTITTIIGGVTVIGSLYNNELPNWKLWRTNIKELTKEISHLQIKEETNNLKLEKGNVTKIKDLIIKTLQQLKTLIGSQSLKQFQKIWYKEQNEQFLTYHELQEINDTKYQLFSQNLNWNYYQYYSEFMYILATIGNKLFSENKQTTNSEQIVELKNLLLKVANELHYEQEQVNEEYLVLKKD